MATLATRLNELERKATETDTGYVIHIHRAGREVETPLHFVHHTTGEIYYHDSDTSHLKGVNVMMAIYAD